MEASLLQPPVVASLAYHSGGGTNSEPFILSPILNLPPSFGSAYVGETFSCTLCANPRRARARHGGEVPPRGAHPGGDEDAVVGDRLQAGPEPEHDGGRTEPEGRDLEKGQTMQKVVNFDLKEEGNHVLAVTVSYYEGTDTSGRTRTFRKLYQFICKASMIVRTKRAHCRRAPEAGGGGFSRRSWRTAARTPSSSSASGWSWSRD